MADETLLQITKSVRAKTLRILDGVSEEQAAWLPAGLHNHVLWNAGHALIVTEHLAVSPVTGKAPSYPEGWFEKFSWKSDPASVKEWPTAAEVRAQLADQIERLTAAIGPLTEDRLGKPAKEGDPRTLRTSILLAVQDEAGHQGEMYMLKKLQTKATS
jgi:DinB superfamily